MKNFIRKERMDKVILNRTTQWIDLSFIEYLKQVIPYFFEVNPADERPIAFIQTRWGHVNPYYSLQTTRQSLAIDTHFLVEQYPRSRGSYWFNFNGTAGIWRIKAVLDAGDWTTDTLTEELDLSYRAFFKGLAKCVLVRRDNTG